MDYAFTKGYFTQSAVACFSSPKPEAFVLKSFLFRVFLSLHALRSYPEVTS